MEVGAPTGRWQLVVVYRGKHDPLCVTYLAALQVGCFGWVELLLLLLLAATRFCLLRGPLTFLATPCGCLLNSSPSSQ